MLCSSLQSDLQQQGLKLEPTQLILCRASRNKSLIFICTDDETINFLSAATEQTHKYDIHIKYRADVHWIYICAPLVK